MARSYRTRPSELVGVADGWLAYQLDRAVMAAGNLIEARVGAAEAEAIRDKRDPGQAAQAALRAALEGPRPAVARRRGPRRRFRYDLSAAGGPRVAGVETVRA